MYKNISISFYKCKQFTYIDIGTEVLFLTPLDLKSIYRSLYSHYFRKVKDTRNKYYGVKTLSTLINIMHHLNYFDVIN